MEDPEILSKQKRPPPPPPSLNKPTRPPPPVPIVSKPPLRDLPKIPTKSETNEENSPISESRPHPEPLVKRGRSVTTLPNLATSNLTNLPNVPGIPIMPIAPILPTTSSSPTLCNDEERNKVIGELVSTEETYVKDLQVVVEKFQEPLEQRNLLSPTEVKRLFWNIGSIYKLHTNVLSKLNANLQTGKQHPRQTILLNNIFPVEENAWKNAYIEYCHNLSESMKFLDSIKKKSNIQMFLKEAKEDPMCKSLELIDFLMTPMQRICRYPLLLKEITKYTPSSHEDFKTSSFLLESLTKFVKEINETAKESTNLTIVLEKENSLSGSYFLLMPGRRKFLFEGKFKEISRGKQFISNPVRELWLFADVLFIVKPNKLKKNIYNYKEFIPVPKLQFSSVEDSEDMKNAIKINHSAKKDLFFLLCAPAPENKSQWLKVLEDAIKSSDSIDEGLLNQLQVMEIQDQIDKIEKVENNFFRSLIQQGPLKVEDKMVYFFLFSDVLVYASEFSGSKKKNYSLKGFVPTHQILIVPLEGTSFEIIRTDTKTKLIVRAQSEEERAGWLENFYAFGSKLNSRRTEQQKKLWRQSVYTAQHILKKNSSSSLTSSPSVSGSDDDEEVSLTELRKQLVMEQIDLINTALTERQQSMNSLKNHAPVQSTSNHSSVNNGINNSKSSSAVKKLPSFGPTKPRKEDPKVALNKAEQAAVEYM